MNFTIRERQRESFVLEFNTNVSLEEAAQEVSGHYHRFSDSETTLSTRRGENGLYWLVEIEQKPHLVIQTQSSNSGFEVWYHFFCKNFTDFYEYMKGISTKQENK